MLHVLHLPVVLQVYYSSHVGGLGDFMVSLWAGTISSSSSFFFLLFFNLLVAANIKSLVLERSRREKEGAVGIVTL